MEKSEKPLAVITGASSGIGYELAKQFGQHGFSLLITAENDAIALAADRLKKDGFDCEYIQLDLTLYSQVEKLAEKIDSLGQPVDVLCLNAGVGVWGDFARESDLNEELSLIDLNIKSTVHLAKIVSRDMVTRGKGRLLFTSSVVSDLPGPFEAVYAASKAFIESFSQALRNELKGTGVTVTVLMPGATETNFFHRAGMDHTKVGSSKKDDPEMVAKDGFEAVMAGKDHVVAGSFMNKLQTTVAKILPEKAKAAIHRGKTEPTGEGQPLH